MKVTIRWMLWAVSALVLAINLLLPATGGHAQSSHDASRGSAAGNSTPIDATAPKVSAFTLPATSIGGTVPVLNFTTSDNFGVTGYLITRSAVVPAASASGWSDATPASITAPGAGDMTFYAWARDAGGNVSAPLSAKVTITLAAASDLTHPALTVSTLDDDAFTNTRTLKVRGNATDDGSLRAVTVNGSSVRLDAHGNFSTAVVLVEGENIITVVATDVAGNSTINARAITYIVNRPEVAQTSSADNLVSLQELHRGGRGPLA